MPQNNPTFVSASIEAVVNVRQKCGSCGGCREVGVRCGICSEEIVMWRCEEEVEGACNDIIPVGRERFVPNGRGWNKNVNVSCEYF